MIGLELRTDEQLLRARDVARILNVSRAMAYRVIQRGDIPVVRIGNAVRVRLSDLQEYVKRAHQNEFEDELL